MGEWTKKEKIYKEKPAFNPAIMVWGGISDIGKTALYIKPSNESINQEVYIGILEEYLLPFTEIFIPDGIFELLQIMPDHI